MSYCSKCGNKVDDTMTFCPRCGASLKIEEAARAAPTPQYPPQYVRRNEKAEKNEKGEKNEKNEPEKHEKGHNGAIGWLIGGLVIIMIGAFSLLRIYYEFDTQIGWSIFLLAIGMIIIIGAIYLAMNARKRSPHPT
jgi:uncharacterized membrane protein YvbJ